MRPAGAFPPIAFFGRKAIFFGNIPDLGFFSSFACYLSFKPIPALAERTSLSLGWLHQHPWDHTRFASADTGSFTHKEGG